MNWLVLLSKCDFSADLTYRVLSACISGHGLRRFAELCRYRMDPAIPAETGKPISTADPAQSWGEALFFKAGCSPSESDSSPRRQRERHYYVTTSSRRTLARHAALPGETVAGSAPRNSSDAVKGRRRAAPQKSALGQLWDATPKAPAQRVAAVAVAGVLVAGIATTGQASTPEPQAASNNAAAAVITADAAANLDFARVSAKSIPAEKKPGSSTNAASSEIQAVNDPAGAQAFAASQLASFGWEQGQMSCLTSLWTRESGWRTTAENPSSLAYGIAQSLPAQKMASAGADYRTNYKTQITWGLGYIKQRYGSPCGAWGKSQAVGWY